MARHASLKSPEFLYEHENEGGMCQTHRIWLSDVAVVETRAASVNAVVLGLPSIAWDFYQPPPELCWVEMCWFRMNCSTPRYSPSS